MLRVVVAIVLAVALLSVSLPALDTARHDHSEQRVHATLARLTAAIADVHAREAAVREGAAGAQRIVTVRLPARTWADAGIEYLAIGAHPDHPGVDEANESTFVWQVTGNQPQERRVTSVPVEADTESDENPLVIQEPGVHRLVVTLSERRNRTVVVVKRLQQAQR